MPAVDYRDLPENLGREIYDLERELKEKLSAPRLFKVVTHFAEDDPKFDGDYFCIEVFENDKVVRKYGDHYHDEGLSKLEGFFHGLDYAGVKYEIVKENKADGYY